ncbi:MAG: hypothetical protein U5M23_05000 [Marinagarivorans sp.]|nr:hypothetical protein [Marinagarivorans sp.]
MKYLLAIFSILISANALAWHTVGGKIDHISVYSATDIVIVTFVNSAGAAITGPEVEACTNKSEFAISTSIPAERRQQMLSILMMAKATGASVTISYDTASGCVPYGSSASAYRGIVRVIL